MCHMSFWVSCLVGFTDCIVVSLVATGFPTHMQHCLHLMLLSVLFVVSRAWVFLHHQLTKIRIGGSSPDCIGTSSSQIFLKGSMHLTMKRLIYS